jgi:hypothetical protein
MSHSSWTTTAALGQRDAALGLSVLREKGVDPRAVVAFVASLAGQSPPASRISAREWTPFFQASAVGTETFLLTPERLANLVSLQL